MKPAESAIISPVSLAALGAAGGLLAMSPEPWVAWIGMAAAVLAAFGVLWRTGFWIINRCLAWQAWYSDGEELRRSIVLEKGRQTVRIRIKPRLRTEVKCLHIDFVKINWHSLSLRTVSDPESPSVCEVVDEYVEKGWSPTQRLRRQRDAGKGMFVFYEPAMDCPAGESIWLIITIEAQHDWDGFLSIQHRFGAPWRRAARLPLKAQ